MEQTAKDTVALMELLGDAFAELKEHEMLQRVVDEQLERLAEGWKLRDIEDFSSLSLQNPSDEDATFRKKAGKGYKGYVGNIVVSFNEHGAIITGMDYQPNIYSDIEFCRDVLADEKSDKENPITTIADGAYGSDEVIDIASDRFSGNSRTGISISFQSLLNS